jgi:hypothetical protein
MGGQDVVYVKQDKSSPLSPSEIKEHLDRLGDQLFTGTCTLPPSHKSKDHKFKVHFSFLHVQINSTWNDLKFTGKETITMMMTGP